MTGWNMPPGVNEWDIPGNRPEDVMEEHFWTAFEHKLAEENIEVPDGENDSFDAWNSDWFIRAVDMARNMGYNLGYAQGEGDAQMAEAYHEMKTHEVLDNVMNEFRTKLHDLITEMSKKYEHED